jgi:hypothetical protein
VNAAVGCVVEVPRIRGLTAVLKVPGMRPAVARVPVDSTTLESTAHMRIRRASVLSGRIVDPLGGSCAGVRVVAYVRLDVPDATLDFEPLQAMGHGVSRLGPTRLSDSSVVTFVTGGRARDDGTFAVTLNVDGDVLLETEEVGRRPMRRHLQWTGSSVSGVVLDRGAAIASNRVRLSYEGAPVPTARVVVVDVSLPVGQPMRSVSKSSASGETELFGLEVGHRYFVDVDWVAEPGVRRSKSGFLTWSLQQEVRLDLDLSTEK